MKQGKNLNLLWKEEHLQNRKLPICGDSGGGRQEGKQRLAKVVRSLSWEATIDSQSLHMAQKLFILFEERSNRLLRGEEIIWAVVQEGNRVRRAQEILQEQ